MSHVTHGVGSSPERLALSRISAGVTGGQADRRTDGRTDVAWAGRGLSAAATSSSRVIIVPDDNNSLFLKRIFCDSQRMTFDSEGTMRAATRLRGLTRRYLKTADQRTVGTSLPA